MSLKPFNAVPQNLREWSRYLDDVAVTPDALSVDTSKLKNKSVTYGKIQDVSNDRLLGRGEGSPGVTQEISVGNGLEFSGTTIRRSALTGDVAASAGSNTLTIQPKAVIYADIQDVTSTRLLGNTAALGPVEEISVSAPLQLASAALSIDLTHIQATPLSGSATYDPPSLADGVGTTTTVTVTGAVLGGFAMASFSLDLQGITVTAYVSAADTVSVRFQNESGGLLDLGSGTLKARVYP